MKAKPECMLCMLNRVLKMGEKLNLVDEQVVELGREIMRLLIEEFNLESVPAAIGTKREKILQRVLSNRDPYSEIKKVSNEVAIKAWKSISDKVSVINDSKKKFEFLCLSSLLANSFEWFVQDYSFDLEEFTSEFQKIDSLENLKDDIDKLWNDLIKAKSVVFILDNAGEAVFDLIWFNHIRGMNKNIVLVAREKPILNDITTKEVLELSEKLNLKISEDEIIPAGWFLGVFLNDETNPRFLEVFKTADLIIAKGMAAYESLSEIAFDKPVYVLLKAKCNPVADSLGVKRGAYVIRNIQKYT